MINMCKIKLEGSSIIKRSNFIKNQKNMKKIIVSVFVMMLIVEAIPIIGMAQTVSTSTLQAQITALLQQINSLNAQILNLQAQKSETIAALKTTLGTGSQGENVKILQAILAADPEIYPEGIISGYFGQLTSQATKRFQKKHGIEQVGFVGPKTLKKLNDELIQNPLSFETTTTATSTSATSTNVADKKLCAKVPPGHLIAPGWLRKNNGVQPIIPSCQILPPGIISNPNYPGTTPTTTPTTTPDITAPIITNISAILTYNSAAISWTTNEVSDSQISYGTSTAYGSLTALNSTMTTNHSQTISGLSSNTAYHYQVRSKDASGNLATSTNQTFTTPAAPADTTAPIISSLSVAPSSTSAIFTWNTNEAATSKIYYSTSSVDTTSTSTPLVSDLTLKTSHLLTTNGLAPTTTYFFVIESIDAANNKANTNGSFVTAQ